MRFLISFLFLLTFTSEVTACLVAKQSRIIPIGTSEGCLIALEIISWRYGGPREEILWSMDFTLKGYNYDYSDFQLDETEQIKDVKQDDMLSVLKVEFAEFYAVCMDFDDFEAFLTKEIRFCDYQKKTSNLKLLVGKTELKCKLKNLKKPLPISFLNDDYTGKSTYAYKDYFNFYFDEANSVIGEDLKVSSFRIHENSEYKLSIFHLGTGQEFMPAGMDTLPPKKEEVQELVSPSLKHSLFIEPILHHGKGFDYFYLFKNN